MSLSPLTRWWLSCDGGNPTVGACLTQAGPFLEPSAAAEYAAHHDWVISPGDGEHGSAFCPRHKADPDAPTRGFAHGEAHADR